jgi:hypothetical protein
MVTPRMTSFVVQVVRYAPARGKGRARPGLVARAGVLAEGYSQEPQQGQRDQQDDRHPAELLR